jgi:hypothetical protein
VRPLRPRQAVLVLRAARLALWSAAAALALLAACQAAAIARVLSSPIPAAEELAALAPAAPAPGDDALPPVDYYAEVWRRLDPVPSPEPPPAPEPRPTVRLREPPPPPYPDMQLLGTIIEDGAGYALIEIEPGESRLLREGAEFRDVRVLRVRHDDVLVEAAGRTRRLRLGPDNVPEDTPGLTP